jgi:hypothetical protein
MRSGQADIVERQARGDLFELICHNIFPEHSSRIRTA